MNADARLSRLRGRLSEEHSEAVLVTTVSNVRYITGFEGVFDGDSNVACLVTEEAARIYTDSRYGEAACQAALSTPWSVRVSPESIYARMCDELAEEGVGLLAVESSIPYGRFRFLSDRLDGRVEATDQWIEELREVKEAAEIDRIARAAAVTDQAFEHILGVVAPGMTEAEVALELEVHMRRNGSAGVAFSSIVASGPNSSRPHATAGERVIEQGDIVLMDLGARVGGYCADLTRTVVMGAASEEYLRVHEAVLEANRAGKAALRGGLTGTEIDKAARDRLQESGFGDRLGHGLGHGVGLDVHELPTLSPRGLRTVPPGSVVTIEPGVYLEGRFGVRIEDLVVVEDEGCRVLSESPRDLIEVR